MERVTRSYGYLQGYYLHFEILEFSSFFDGARNALLWVFYRKLFAEDKLNSISAIWKDDRAAHPGA